MSTSRRTRAAMVGGMFAIAALATPVAAQQAGHGGHTMQMPTSGVRAELIRDIESLEKKYTGLAEAMTGKYAWRPGQGVRSAGEVFMHVAGANFMLPIVWGAKAPEMFAVTTLQEGGAKAAELEKLTDEVKMREHLQHSFMHAKHAIAMTPEDQLEQMVELFGNQVTKRSAMMMIVNHMHEHLGQSIAYARSNNVTPPWSGGN